MMFSLWMLLCLVAAGTSKPTQEMIQSIVLPPQPTAKDPTTARTESPAVQVVEDTVIVLEKATPFVEKISFDHTTGCETLHVPAHNGMYEADIMHCFDQGKTMYCFPEVSKCFVLDITEEGEPGMKEQEKGMTQFEHHSLGIIDGKSAVVQTNNWLIVGSVDRKDLHADLANFHADFSAFAATKIPDNAEFLSDQRGPGNDNGENVEQRNGKTLIDQLRCANNEAPVRKYHVINPRGCEYLVLCPPGTTAGTICEDDRHITDWFYAACLCCPEHTQHYQCAHCATI